MVDGIRTVLHEEHVDETDQQTGSAAAGLRAKVDPFREDQHDQITKHAQQKNNLRHELADEVDFSVEIPRREQRHITPPK